MCDKVEIISDNSVLGAVPIECPVCGTTGSSGATCPGCGNGMPSYNDYPLTIKDGKWDIYHTSKVGAAGDIMTKYSKKVGVCVSGVFS
jgi:hypothetical protein